MKKPAPSVRVLKARIRELEGELKNTKKSLDNALADLVESEADFKNMRGIWELAAMQKDSALNQVSRIQAVADELRAQLGILTNGLLERANRH